MAVTEGPDYRIIYNVPVTISYIMLRDPVKTGLRDPAEAGLKMVTESYGGYAYEKFGQMRDAAISGRWESRFKKATASNKQ